MFQLPGELIDEIFSYLLPPQHDSFPDTSPTQYDAETLKGLATLCRVSKLFYAHAGRLLYNTVAIEDLNSSLIDSLETIDVGWVRSLIIDEHRPLPIMRHNLRPYHSKELERWVKLEDAVERMDKLESLVYHAQHYSPRLSAAVSKRPFLRQLTSPCILRSLESAPPTQSLSIYCIPRFAHKLDSLKSLVTRSARQLQTLHLSLRYIPEAQIPELLETIFAESFKIPLKELVLDWPTFTPDAVKILTSVIDMSGLVRLDLRESGTAECLMSTLTGQLKNLRWLRIEGPVAPFIGSFSTLEYLSWTNKHDRNINVDVLVQHGASLKNLYLFTPHIIPAADVQKLAAACQKLEALNIKVDFDELESIAASLATLKSLKELYITPNMEEDILTLPDGPFHVRPVSFGDEGVLKRDVSSYYPFLPYLPDGIDAAFGILLVGGVSCSHIGVSGFVPPYHGIWDHTMVWGRVAPRLKRWVKNGKADDEQIRMSINYRGGNVGDRYRCDGIEEEWELMDPYTPLKDQEPKTLGAGKISMCCAKGKCGGRIDSEHNPDL